jgi:hypothetical protein
VKVAWPIPAAAAAVEERLAERFLSVEMAELALF